MSLRAIARLTLARTGIGGLLSHVPFAERAYARYAMALRNHPGIFAGVYHSYDDALAHIPRGRRTGWDNPEAAAIWIDGPEPLAPSSYPAFFWLAQLLRPDCTLIDFGGGIGLTYYSFRRFAPLPPGMRWIVVEVPEIVRQGRAVAERRAAAGLEFISDIAQAPAADILLSAGALQYMRSAVPGLLHSLVASPRHILLNKLPLTSRKPFYTLQNFGPAVSPYRIFNRSDFLGYFMAEGYTLRDEWSVVDLACDIPFHPRQNVPQFCGLVLQRGGRNEPMPAANPASSHASKGQMT